MKRLLTILLLIFTSTVFGQTKEHLTFAQPSDPVATVQYSGAVTNGKANGYGEAQFFKNGKPDGSYKGLWKDNDCHGKGEYPAISGDKYEGDWLNDIPNEWLANLLTVETM